MKHCCSKVVTHSWNVPLSIAGIISPFTEENRPFAEQLLYAIKLFIRQHRHNVRKKN